MQHKSLVEQEMNWCAHFNGLMNDTCRAGVRYEDVRERTDAGPFRFPCFRDDNAPHLCDQCRYRTREEAEEKERRVHESLRLWSADLAADICPHCKTPITLYAQVGRSVYADPCGHRLYQGKAPKGKPHTVTRLEGDLLEDME